MGILYAGKLIKGYSALRKGMSKREVIDLFGTPTLTRDRYGIETYIWKNNEWKGVLRGGTLTRTVEVDFEDDKVTGWDSENLEKTRW